MSGATPSSTKMPKSRKNSAPVMTVIVNSSQDTPPYYQTAFFWFAFAFGFSGLFLNFTGLIASFPGQTFLYDGLWAYLLVYGITLLFLGLASAALWVRHVYNADSTSHEHHGKVTAYMAAQWLMGIFGFLLEITYYYRFGNRTALCSEGTCDVVALAEYKSLALILAVFFFFGIERIFMFLCAMMHPEIQVGTFSSEEARKINDVIESMRSSRSFGANSSQIDI